MRGLRAGRQRLRELLLDESTDERTFAVQVAFCQTLSASERIGLFEQRRAELNRRLAKRARADEGRTDTYRRSLREHDTRTITHDLAWLDELLDAARAELVATSQVANPDDTSHLTGGTNS